LSPRALLGRAPSALLAVALGAAGAGAEPPRAELFAGYGYARAGGDEPELEPERGLHGFEAALAWSLGARLGLVADASGHFGSLDGTDLTRWYFLAGPRLSFRRERLTYFVQALAGAARTSESLTVVDLTLSESGTGFAAAAGGGIDFGIGRRWAVRLQGDLTRVDLGDESDVSGRAAAGLVFRFGGS
jgi:hypothetical protein